MAILWRKSSGLPQILFLSLDIIHSMPSLVEFVKLPQLLDILITIYPDIFPFRKLLLQKKSQLLISETRYLKISVAEFTVLHFSASKNSTTTDHCIQSCKTVNFKLNLRKQWMFNIHKMCYTLIIDIKPVLNWRTPLPSLFGSKFWAIEYACSQTTIKTIRLV